MELQRRHVLATYAAADLMLVRGQGARVWDSQGRCYLDFAAGISVCNLGHCHPRVTAAIREQAGKLVHVSNLFYNENQPRLAALIAPSFTEPEAVLTAAGVPVCQVVLPAPFELAAADVPEQADLVVVGNPTNPTGVLHPREQILALRRPGRILVVDEAFADAIPGEPESLAGCPAPDVVVVRSLTKTWSLAGLRVGYALGAPEVLARLTARRAHWPLGTLQLEAVASCLTRQAVAEAEAGARRLVQWRTEMLAALTGLGLDVVDGCAPFVLFEVPDAELVRKRLAGKGIAVRRCDTFVGLGGGYLRAAVRAEWPVLIDAIAEVLS